MKNNMNDFDDGMKRAQAQYDAQMPPEDEHEECEECEGTGKVFDDGAPDRVAIKCEKCDGEGVIYPEECDDEPRERFIDDE